MATTSTPAHSSTSTTSPETARTSSRSPTTAEERAERSAAKLAEAHEMLAAEVVAIQSGEQWRAYLALQARLHRYSANNALLIAAQHARAYSAGLVSAPEPSVVAGFNTWRALGRVVERGQHGYAVLAPLRYDRRVAMDSSGEVRSLGHSESAAPGERVETRQVLAGFRIEHVFDLSQTSGDELALPPLPRVLEGAAPVGLGASVVGLIEARGFHLETVPDAAAIDGANGQTDWQVRTVTVRADMDEAAIVKTLLHEAAHVLLHEGPPGRYLPRAVKEVEAESVAFVVAAAHDMATGDYSFAYVATWAGNDGLRAVQATQQRVARAAREIIEQSPAPHLTGGTVPGAERAIAEAQARRAERARAVEAGHGHEVAQTATPAVEL